MDVQVKNTAPTEPLLEPSIWSGHPNQPTGPHSCGRTGLTPHGPHPPFPLRACSQARRARNEARPGGVAPSLSSPTWLPLSLFRAPTAPSPLPVARQRAPATPSSPTARGSMRACSDGRWWIDPAARCSEPTMRRPLSRPAALACLAAQTLLDRTGTHRSPTMARHDSPRIVF